MGAGAEEGCGAGGDGGAGREDVVNQQNLLALNNTWSFDDESFGDAFATATRVHASAMSLCVN